MNNEQIKNIAINAEKALTSAIKRQSVVDQTLLISLSDSRDVISLLNEEDEDDFDMALDVLIKRKFESVDGFNAAYVQIKFMVHFFNCDYDVGSQNYLKGDGTCKLFHNYYRDNIQWSNEEGIVISEQDLAITREESQAIHDRLITGIFGSQNANIESFHCGLIEAANNIFSNSTDVYGK